MNNPFVLRRFSYQQQAELETLLHTLVEQRAQFTVARDDEGWRLGWTAEEPMEEQPCCA